MSTALTTAHLDSQASLPEIFELGQQLRVDSVRASTAAGSGHPSSSMSAADLMAVLITRYLRYDWSDADNPGNDCLIFSKGHASPLLYSIFKAAGVVTEQELLEGYRQAGSRLQGHPTPILPWVPAATGSLGQGVGIGVGMALGWRWSSHSGRHAWILCGDGEMAEGSVWEALTMAARMGLAHVTVMIDVNRMGQQGPTSLEWDLSAYAQRAEAVGCHAIVIDGHDLSAIDEALKSASSSLEPTVIVARTHKGRGFHEIEDKEGWHGKALPAEMAERAVQELGGIRELTVRGPQAVTREPIEEAARDDSRAGQEVARPRFSSGKPVAPRLGFGKGLAALGANPKVVALDAEVGNSTHAEEFAKEHPERYVECYIAEQQMLATAVGLAAAGYRPFASTFAAFLTRAHDFIRMAAISGVDLALVGTHCGVEIGADGPSQMALEDLAMMRAVHGSTVLYPADATSAAALTIAMADLPGISYLRATRGAYPLLYGADEAFPVGGSKTLRESDRDQVTLIGAGVTLHECLKAADSLASDGVPARVLDLYSVKPIDVEALTRAAADTKAMLVVEDHHPEGGLGEAVLSTLAAKGVAVRFGHLAVRMMPDSRSPEEELDAAGLSARHIAATAKRLLAGHEAPEQCAEPAPEPDGPGADGVQTGQ
jgi:transketolase